MSRSLDTAPETTAEREAYYEKIAAHNMTPLWEVLHQLLAREPKSPAEEILWHGAAEAEHAGMVRILFEQEVPMTWPELVEIYGPA